MEVGGSEIGDDGHLGGFEALRLIRFVFLGVGFWRSDRMLVVAGEWVLSPPLGRILTLPPEERGGDVLVAVPERFSRR